MEKLQKIFTLNEEIDVWNSNNEKGAYTFEEYALNKYSKDPGNFLVVGCGAGRELMSIDNKHNLYGIDYSFNILNSNKTLKSKYRVINCDAENFAFKSNFFNYVCAFEQCFSCATPYKKRNNWLKDLNRICKTGAKLFFVVHNVNGSLKFKSYHFFNNILYKIFKNIVFPLNHEFGDVYLKSIKNGGFSKLPCFPKSENAVVFHHFTNKELNKLFLENGFKILELNYLKHYLKNKENIVVGSDNGIGTLCIAEKIKNI